MPIKEKNKQRKNSNRSTSPGLQMEYSNQQEEETNFIKNV